MNHVKTVLVHWRKSDKYRALDSEGGGDLTELDRICADISERIDDDEKYQKTRKEMQRKD